MICDSLVNLKPTFSAFARAQLQFMNPTFSILWSICAGSATLLVLLVFFVLRFFYFQCLVD